jgi:hypothetical protein
MVCVDRSRLQVIVTAARRDGATTTATHAPVNSVLRGCAFLSSVFMTGPEQLMTSTSLLGSPHACSRRMNCSNATDTFESTLTSGLLPMYSAPITCAAGRQGRGRSMDGVRREKG